MPEATCTCGKAQEVGEQCRRCYQRDYRARKKGGEGALILPGITVPCGRQGCTELVRLTGARRRKYEDQGIAAYHSHECQVAATHVEVPCAGCGRPLLRYKAAVEASKTGRYVCNDCRNTTGCKPRRGQEHTCIGCGETFYRRPGDDNPQFHSRECRQQYDQERRITLACEGCGVTFDVSLAIVKLGRRFHDAACKNLAMTKNRVPGQWHNGKPKRRATGNAAGYVLIWEPGHPRAFQGGWVFEHRWVMEQTLGRYLAREEQVDHINEVKDDNRLENLRVLDPRSHQRVTAANAKRRRASDRAELEELRRMLGSLSAAAEAALRSDGYRPIGELLDEARAVLDEAATGDINVARIRRVLAVHGDAAERERYAAAEQAGA